MPLFHHFFYNIGNETMSDNDWNTLKSYSNVIMLYLIDIVSKQGAFFLLVMQNEFNPIEFVKILRKQSGFS